MAGADRFRTLGCDVIVAVGGGSPIDCAKGIGIVAANGQHILAFGGADRVPLPMPPVICVPTTGGTSADVSQFAIVTDRDKRTKITIVSKAVVPDVALVDPRTLLTMDPYLTACTGMDALVHAIEAFVSSGSSPLTDLHALEAIRLVTAWLPACLRDPGDLEARTHMMMGSLSAGLAFSNASLGAVHAMSHSLGGALDLPHGECNSIMLDHVLAFNFSAAAERCDRIGEAMGLSYAAASTTATSSAVGGARAEGGHGGAAEGRTNAAAQKRNDAGPAGCGVDATACQG
jgi:alcohol dehydrogenase class IV